MAESSTWASIFVRAAGIGILSVVVILLALYFFNLGMSPRVRERPLNVEGVQDDHARRLMARQSEVDRIMLIIEGDEARRQFPFPLNTYRSEVEAIYDMRDRAVQRNGALSWWDLPQQTRDGVEQDFIRRRDPAMRLFFEFVNRFRQR